MIETYSSKIRQILLRYPKPSAKVFIDPLISNCDKGMLNNFNTDMVEVNTPEEADCIPIYISYIDKVSDEVIENYINKYSDKCTNVFNYILQLLSENEKEITNDEIHEIVEMLSSPDWESIYLGLNMLLTYKWDDTTEMLARTILQSFSPNFNNNTGTIVPLGHPLNVKVTIQNLDLIKFYFLLLYNQFLKV